MKPDEYLYLMAKVSASWPHNNITPDTIKFGASLLEDIDADQAMAAVDEYLSDGAQFAPTVGMIRKRAVELSMPLFPTTDQAWKEVREQVTACGWVAILPGGRKPVWSHPVIGEVAEAIGWQTLCESENEMADRAHFMKLFAARVEREASGQRMPPSVRELRDQSERGGEPSSLSESLGSIALGPGSEPS